MTEQQYAMALEQEKRKVAIEFIQGSDLQSYKEMLAAPMADARFVEVPKSRERCTSCMTFIGPGRFRKCQTCLHKPAEPEKDKEEKRVIIIESDAIRTEEIKEQV